MDNRLPALPTETEDLRKQMMVAQLRAIHKELRKKTYLPRRTRNRLKEEMRALMLEIREKEGLTFEEIGAIIGITRERASQITGRVCRKAKSKFAFLPGLLEERVARELGVCSETLAKLRRQGLLHPQKFGIRGFLYPETEIERAKELLGSREWGKKIQLVCTTCGIQFSLSLAEYRIRLRRRKYKFFFFHSRSCFSRWIGKRSRRIPEEVREQVRVQWQKTHYSIRRLSKIFQLSETTVSKILNDFEEFRVYKATLLQEGKAGFYDKRELVGPSNGQRECLGCGSFVPVGRRGYFCSLKCYQSLRGFWRRQSEKA